MLKKVVYLKQQTQDLSNLAYLASGTHRLGSQKNPFSILVPKREHQRTALKKNSKQQKFFFLYFIYFLLHFFTFFYRYTARTSDRYLQKITLQTYKEKKTTTKKTTLLYTTLHYATRIKTHIQLELKLKSNLGYLRKRSLGNSYCCINGSRGFHFLSWNWILLFFFRDKTFGLKRLFKFID